MIPVEDASSQELEKNKISLMDGLKIVIADGNFIKMCVALTVLYFVLTGI